MGVLWTRDEDGNAVLDDDDAAPGGSSTVISDTDPGAIGAGGLWIRTDPTESYAPTIQVRNAADDGWLDSVGVGLLLGLTYYDDDGNVATCIYGGPTFAQIATVDGQLTVSSNATLSGNVRGGIVGANSGVWAENDLVAVAAGPTSRFLLTPAGGQLINRLAIGIGLPGLPDGKGAVVFGTSDEIGDSDLGSISRDSCSFSYDNTDGAAKLKIKARTADGTIVHGEVALT